MNKAEKAEFVARIADKLKDATGLYLVNYHGVTVEEVNELRREFRKANVEYRVVKNTLAKLAIDRINRFEKAKEYLVGMTGLAIPKEDPVVPAKIIKKFREKYNKLDLKACYVETSFYDGSKLDELASLPSKPEIIAGIIGGIQSPISGLIGSINAVMRDLVGVLDAYIKKQESN
jgi:large subunit ribosomal protein L10